MEERLTGTMGKTFTEANTVGTGRLEEGFLVPNSWDFFFFLVSSWDLFCFVFSFLATLQHVGS